MIVTSIAGQLVGWRSLQHFDLSRAPWFMHVAASPLWGIGVPVVIAGLALWLGRSAKPRTVVWILLAVVAFACEATMLILGEVI